MLSVVLGQTWIGGARRNCQTIICSVDGCPAWHAKRVIGNLNIPIYDGGMAAAQVRQAKEVLAQTRIVLDRVRTQTGAAVVAAWVTHEGAQRIALAAFAIFLMLNAVTPFITPGRP